jgi:hypothetical protein
VPTKIVAKHVNVKLRLPGFQLACRGRYNYIIAYTHGWLIIPNESINSGLVLACGAILLQTNNG